MDPSELGLVVASSSGDLPRVRELLNQIINTYSELDRNQKAISGNAAQDFGYRNRLLMDLGNRMHDLEKEVAKALIHASENGRIDVIQELLNSSPPGLVSDRVLILASEHNQLGLIKQLLKRGANIHLEDDQALIIAAARGYLSIVQELLNRGADIHAQNDRALIYAAGNGYPDVVRELLDRGANIHASNDEPLFEAIRGDHLNVVRELLDQGANIHARNDIILLYAADHDSLVPIIQELIDRGADTSKLPSKYQYLVPKPVTIGEYRQTSLLTINNLLQTGQITGFTLGNYQIEGYARQLGLPVSSSNKVLLFGTTSGNKLFTIARFDPATNQILPPM